jgi:hypothetical protein
MARAVRERLRARAAVSGSTEWLLRRVNAALLLLQEDSTESGEGEAQTHL